jgi:hypothetical protein
MCYPDSLLLVGDPHFLERRREKNRVSRGKRPEEKSVSRKYAEVL